MRVNICCTVASYGWRRDGGWQGGGDDGWVRDGYSQILAKDVKMAKKRQYEGMLEFDSMQQHF